MQAMGLFDFLDGIPDDYEPKQRMSKEETEEAFEYLRNHPLFIKEIPENLELHPDLLALQNLSYDDTPENNAKALLARGNEIVQKHGDQPYFMMRAMEIYSDGLEQDCKDGETMAKLFSNRALLSYKKKNYKAALQDCKWAIEKDPKFIKPYYRSAQCLYQMTYFEEALRFCNLALELRKEADVMALKQDIERQLDAIKKKQESQEKLKQVFRVCKEKRIRVGPANVSLPAGYEPQRLSLKQQNPPIITTPILVTYPEFRQRDFIKAASEEDRLIDQLGPLFEEQLPWDRENLYTLDNIECYIQLDDGAYIELNKKATILRIMQGYKVTVRDFIEIILVSRKSEYYKKEFRNEYQIVWEL